MNLVPFLVLPIVGGYAFSTIWTGSLYYSARESGHRLYFRAVFYAVFLIICATLVHIIWFVKAGSYQSWIHYLNVVLTIKSEDLAILGDASKLTILFISLILGPILGHLLNFSKLPFLTNFTISINFSNISFLSNLTIPCITFKPFLWWERLLLNHAIKNNDFEKLIARAAYSDIPVLFTLGTGKVYVGWTVTAPNPTQTRKAVRILPLLSGYRSPEDQTVQFTTNYYDVLNGIIDGKVLDHLELSDFEVVLPVDQICASHLFDVQAYNQFFLEDDTSGPTN